MLALPEAAQTELFSLYARYREAVADHMDKGWSPRLLSGDIVEASANRPTPARQIETSIHKRDREIRDLQMQLDQAGPQADTSRLRDRLDVVRAERESLRDAYSRPKGTCLDWSDLVWAELGRLKPEHWSLHEETRKARPFHTGAVLCTSPGPARICLAFDPWPEGRADVYEFGSWNQGSFAARLPADFFLHQLPQPAAPQAQPRP